jgi:4-aminobutyrate aminotransferase / (S)-3-amino-2-methylpropionate transaminase / 5-aminovalerate transaminase
MTVATTPLEQRRKLTTQLPGPRSKELHDRRTHAVSSGLTVGFPVYIERAEGAILLDVDGNQLVDLGSGIAVASVGHAVPEVAAAVARQSARFNHTCFMVTPYEGYVEVCEALNDLTPGAHDKRSALFNSGAEAVENAVKIARLATGRQAIVVFEHAYHGRTNLTMALTAKNMPYKDRFGPFAPEVYRVPTSYPFRDGLSGEAAAAAALAQVESDVGARNVAAVLIEPIQGEGGFVVPADGFLPALSAWCTGAGALFIADEIQTGFCRTGAWFACEHEGVVPDLVTTAKGIAAGLPLAAVTGPTNVMNAVHEGGLGGTYGGNPVACAAALAAIEVMRRDDLAARARWIEGVVRPRLEALAASTPGIGEVRGRGAMLAIEFVVPGTTTPDAAAVKSVLASCHAEGVVAISCGTYGNVIRLLPPLSIDEALLDDGLGVLESAVGALDGGR